MNLFHFRYDPSAFSARVGGSLAGPEATPYYLRFVRNEKCADFVGFVGHDVKGFELRSWGW